MRLSLRLILFLVVGISLVTFFICQEPGALGKARPARGSAAPRGNSGRKPAGDCRTRLAEKFVCRSFGRTVERYENRQQLAGVVIYDEQGKVLAESSTLVTRLTPPPVPLDQMKAGPPGRRRVPHAERQADARVLHAAAQRRRYCRRARHFSRRQLHRSAERPHLARHRLARGRPGAADRFYHRAHYSLDDHPAHFPHRAMDEGCARGPRGAAPEIAQRRIFSRRSRRKS